MPELAAARKAARGNAPRSGRRLAVTFAGGVAAAALAGLVVYPYANADETGVFSRVQGRAAQRADAVTVPALSTVRETAFMAPALMEPATVPLPSPPVVKPTVENAPRTIVRPSAEAAIVASPPVEPEAVILGDAKLAETPSPAPEPRAAPSDPWHTLRSTLQTCARSDGLWARATCEQRAGLAYCDGHWGIHALCPSGRTEYGQ